MDIASGLVRAYFLFDVADTIDLANIRTTGGSGLAPADLPLRTHASSAYLQFPVPPLVARLPDAVIGDLAGTVRVKLFDYGVISLRLSFPANGSWEHLFSLSERLRRNEPVAHYAHETVLSIIDDLGAALDDPHPALIEDYLVIDIEHFAEPITSEALLRDHAPALANILLGERNALARQEIDESLRVRFSYNADDLTVVQWDTAFIYDDRESSDAIQDILEFANSQLLELRTYDALLDSELDELYTLQPGHRSRSLLGRREAEQATMLRYMIVDILELTDRSTNALKIVGDAYYARIYRSAAARLGLSDWQRQIDSKLASVGDMYRFFIDQSRIRRDEFMELIVIVLIALELIVGVATLVRH
ncbi:MAG: hypothetical protein ABI282_05340 [Candidatus Baltobacteraceae bacterium]